MPLRQSATAVINALMRRSIRRRARARYLRRHGPGLSPRSTALIVASALFMEQLDGTVLATALPEMARSFGTEAVRLNVALTSYLLALAVFIPASGKVADRFGSRTVFCGAIALFTLGSILCGQAGRLGTLVAARVLQGIGGAMMVPVGRLVLLRSVTKAEMVSGDDLADDPGAAWPAARAAGGRLPGDVPVLALDLLHQRAHRRPGHPAGAAVHRRRAGARPGQLRPARPGAVRRVAGLPGVRPGGPEPGRRVAGGGRRRAGAGRAVRGCCTCAMPGAIPRRCWTCN